MFQQCWHSAAEDKRRCHEGTLPDSNAGCLTVDSPIHWKCWQLFTALFSLGCRATFVIAPGLQVQLKQMISESEAKGEMWTRDWDKVPVPGDEPTAAVAVPSARPSKYCARSCCCARLSLLSFKPVGCGICIIWHICSMHCWLV